MGNPSRKSSAHSNEQTPGAKKPGRAGRKMIARFNGEFKKNVLETQYNFTIPTDLTQGKASRVISGTDENNQKVIIKILKGNSPLAVQKAEREIAALQRESYYVEYYKDSKNNYFIIMKKIKGKDLKEIYESHKLALKQGKAGTLALAQIIFNCLKARDALKALHDKGWGHGDVKPDNCMEDQDTQTVKLIDFGNVSFKEGEIIPQKNFVGGNRFFSAPEARQEAAKIINDRIADCWSFGVMLAYFLDLVTVNEYNFFDADKFKENKSSHIAKLCQVYKLDNDNAEKTIDLIIKLTCADREKRGTLEDVKILDEIAYNAWPEAYKQYNPAYQPAVTTPADSVPVAPINTADKSASTATLTKLKAWFVSLNPFKGLFSTEALTDTPKQPDSTKKTLNLLSIESKAVTARKTEVNPEHATTSTESKKNSRGNFFKSIFTFSIRKKSPGKAGNVSESEQVQALPNKENAFFVSKATAAHKLVR